MKNECKLHEDEIKSILQTVTKIHTVLIGNGVPGLVDKHENLEAKVEKNHDNIKKIVYGLGGAMVVMTAILNFDQIKNLFGG